MISGIQRDHLRFKEIVKGKIKENLKKYINHGELLGKQGKDFVSIPIPQIDLPRFKYQQGKENNIGQGDGDIGSQVNPHGGDEGGPSHGEHQGNHQLEVEVSLSELSQMLQEELELPGIQPKGSGLVRSKKHKFSGIHTVGPNSLRHLRRTYKEALKRQIAEGKYDQNNPMIIPIKKDMRFRIWNTIEEPRSNAVIVYMMDVSGSMGDEQKEIVRTESFWIDTWLRSQYQQLKIKYIIHDATAKEVDQHTFYHTRESGGTLISSAYKLCHEILLREFPAEEWNIYALHFSDGDNWSQEDTSLCIQLLKDSLLPQCNMFGYGQVESRYGSGQFIKDLNEKFSEEEKLITSRIENKEAIYRSLKDFLGKGK